MDVPSPSPALSFAPTSPDKGTGIKWDAPRLYGGVMSRRVIERMKAKTGQLFMGSWPDLYMTYASPSVIERHLKIGHPFFIGAASPKSNGVNFLAWARATAPDVEYRRFAAETKLDPLVDPITVAPTIPIGELALLEAANRYAYGGKLPIDYPREFERSLKSLRDVEPEPASLPASRGARQVCRRARLAAESAGRVGR